ncbi:SRPBCC domain-containing protein [Desertihabitans aurantiacus]|uniref:SRPBCC domain-containing protein n=1 Tax=Desertihabitans aurantiacus TaxID=2282477 RepID=UPI000DF73F09|nr:SRPBCC domain-containing protein [Desertihabitans aurantiacus]
MTDDLAYGTLETTEGRPTLRFELALAYPVQRVWQAVSTPEELRCFFPGAADWGPAKGESIDLGGATLEITEVRPPHRLAWVMAGQPQSFELHPDGTGCRLVFVHVIDDLPAAQTATGWQTYLSRLEPHLAGGHLSDEDAHRHWREIHEAYAARFGVDPEPGRRWADQHLPAVSA